MNETTETSTPTPVEMTDDKLFDSIRNGSVPQTLDYMGSLLWTPEARQQFAHVTGFLEGLRPFKPELAVVMLKDLLAELKKLNEYAGKLSIPVGAPQIVHGVDVGKLDTDQLIELAFSGGEQVKDILDAVGKTPTRQSNVRKMKIILYRDSCFGSFNLSAYSAVRRSDLPRGEDEDYDAWQQRHRLLRADDRSDIGFWRVFETDKETGDEYVYRYRFSGGLILHGFGSTFAIELSSDRNHPHWSMHT